MSLRAVALLVLLGSGLYAVLYVATYFARWDGHTYHLFGDFFMLWTGGRFVLEGHARQMYDWDTFHAFQQAVLGHPEGEYPVPYPPSFLPALALVGLLPYVPAFSAWMGTTFAAAAAALYDRDDGPVRVLALLVAPASLVNAVAGHNGFLSAALVVGGMRLLPTQPVAAGVLLGLLSYKPQLFALVPVALVAARAWRALAATIASAGAAALVSVALWGFGPWLDWLAFLPEFSRKVEEYLPRLGPLMVSVSAGLRGLGASRELTAVVQAVALGLALLAVWRAFRRGATPLATATLLTATFLATPYAYTYDLTLVAAAVLLTVAGGRAERMTVLELVVVFLGWVLPVFAIGAGQHHVPVGPPILAAFLLVLDRVGRRSG